MDHGRSNSYDDTPTAEQSPLKPLFFQLAKLNGDSSAQFKQAMELWSKQIARYQDDWPDFVRKRLAEDAELMDTLLNTRDVNTIATTNIEFLKHSFEDYSEHFGNLMTECMCTAIEFWSPLTNGFVGVLKKEQDAGPRAETAQKTTTKAAATAGQSATTSSGSGHRQAA